VFSSTGIGQLAATLEAGSDKWPDQHLTVNTDHINEHVFDDK